MDIRDVIRTRRTVVKSTGPVSREAVFVIEAGTCAPDYKLLQPCGLTVVDSDARERLGRVWVERAGAHAYADRIVDDAVKAFIVIQSEDRIVGLPESVVAQPIGASWLRSI